MARKPESRETLQPFGRPAIADLKAFGASLPLGKEIASLTRKAFNDKHYNPRAWRFLHTFNIAATAFANLALKTQKPEIIQAYEKIIEELPNIQTTSYSGTAAENDLIGRVIDGTSSANQSDPVRSKTREHAAGLLDLGSAKGIMERAEPLRRIPIGIIGAGPAGIIAARTLQELGFTNITVYDPNGEYGGIWTYPNVVKRSKNNPNPMSAFGHTLTASTDAIPGTGHEVHDFLLGIAAPLPPVVKAKVTQVYNVGDLQHSIQYVEDGQTKTAEFPILINAIGNGEPLPVSRPSHMTTDEESAKYPATRWQREFRPGELEKQKGKTITFIGLGNSTAEMLLQVDAFNKSLPKSDRDSENIVKVRILTHYPFSKLLPDDFGTIEIFRNLARPNLTNLAGDLKSIREVFEQALNDGSIVPNVSEWHIKKVEEEVGEGEEKKKVKKNVISITSLEKTENFQDGFTEEFDIDKLFTLIGYGHSNKTLSALGVSIDPDTRVTGQDWDGEVQMETEAESDTGVPIPGYFMVGAIRGGENDNVIPGILFDMPDTAFSVIMRAAEWQMKEGIGQPPFLRAPVPAAVHAEPEPEVEEERVLVGAGGGGRRGRY